MVKRLSVCLVMPATVLVAFLSLGCATRAASDVATLSSHTLEVGPNQTADVVWVERVVVEGNRQTISVLRCHNAPTGPVCRTAETQ